MSQTRNLPGKPRCTACRQTVGSVEEKLPSPSDRIAIAMCRNCGHLMFLHQDGRLTDLRPAEAAALARQKNFNEIRAAQKYITRFMWG